VRDYVLWPMSIKHHFHGCQKRRWYVLRLLSGAISSTWLFFTFKGSYPISWRSVEKCDRKRAHRYIHTYTYIHRQTKTDLIICPMLWYSNGTDKNWWAQEVRGHNSLRVRESSPSVYERNVNKSKSISLLTVLTSWSKWIGKHEQLTSVLEDCRRQCVGGWRSTPNFISRFVFIPTRSVAGKFPPVTALLPIFRPPACDCAVTLKLRQRIIINKAIAWSNSAVFVHCPFKTLQLHNIYCCFT